MDQSTVQQEMVTLPPEEAALDIAGRSLALSARLGRRVLVGIAGGPGSGKSTIAAEVVHFINDVVDGAAARVPMDGFHMRQSKLEAEDMVAYKGAPQTFEAEEFVGKLKILKGTDKSMQMPGYSRAKEDVIPDAFTIAGNVPILVVEGNYLLLNASPWNHIVKLLDLSVYLEVPKNVVRTRLLKRHAKHGLYTEERNKRHIEEVDMVNYDAVALSAPRADLHIRIQTTS